MDVLAKQEIEKKKKKIAIKGEVNYKNFNAEIDGEIIINGLGVEEIRANIYDDNGEDVDLDIIADYSYDVLADKVTEKFLVYLKYKNVDIREELYLQNSINVYLWEQKYTDMILKDQGQMDDIRKKNIIVELFNAIEKDLWISLRFSTYVIKGLMSLMKSIVIDAFDLNSLNIEIKDNVTVEETVSERKE